MSGAYEANPAGLRRSIEEMKRLPALAKKMGEDFRLQENDYTQWPGWTDDFARQVRPQYQKNNEYCTEVAQSLYMALDALVSATLTSLENIEGTRTDATEKIDPALAGGGGVAEAEGLVEEGPEEDEAHQHAGRGEHVGPCGVRAGTYRHGGPGCGDGVVPAEGRQAKA